MSVDKRTFRDAMSRFPSGVTIVTMIDDTGKRWGFTATAVATLSLELPSVLVCLDRSANCYPSFRKTDRFAINILGTDQETLARRFATKGIDKFAGIDFEEGEFRLPLLRDAVVALECRRTALLPGGDHAIFVGQPLSIRLGSGTPTVVFDRRFWKFAEDKVAIGSNDEF
jgi:flavin reductase ActVB